MRLTIEAIRAQIETDLTDEALESKLEAVRAMVKQYAPAAPDAVKTEACIRAVAWLLDRPAAAVEVESGRYREQHAPGHLSALRHCGGMALLSAWKVRRGGLI